MCENFTPNFGNKILAVVAQRTVSHFLLHHGFFLTKAKWLSSPVSPIEDETESPPF
jgi:hypothetical protein